MPVDLWTNNAALPISPTGHSMRNLPVSYTGGPPPKPHALQVLEMSGCPDAGGIPETSSW